MKLINLNLWLGGFLWDEITNFLQKEDADIIAMQEVYRTDEKGLEPRFNGFHELRELLGYQNTHFAPTFIEDMPQYVEQGNAVFSKFPIEEINIKYFEGKFSKRIGKREFFSKSPRNLEHVNVNINGKNLHIINLQGVWAEHGKDNRARLHMADVILDEANKVKNAPLIICGDMNLKPNTKTIEKIEKKYKNIFKGKFETTFNLARKDLKKYPGYATAVVDMVFVNDFVKIKSKSSPNVDISDHLPQIVEFEI